MTKKIIIAGGNGFIGKYLSAQFAASGHEVIIISRHLEHIQWHNAERITEALENSAILINLAGKSVNCRYNEENKAEILRSRTETTRTLGDAILRCANPPALWINSGTATIYRHAEDRPMSDSDGEIGSGFSVDVATQWEQAMFAFHLPRTRQVVLRMSIVLGKNGGALTPLLNLVRLGLGGRQGSGRQIFSWLHIEDLFNIILFVQSHEQLAGAIICSSPNPVDNDEFMRAIRQLMNVRIGLASPEWLLRIGAVLIRTEIELILKSRWVVPEKLLMSGYTFKYPKLDAALSNLLGKGANGNN